MVLELLPQGWARHEFADGLLWNFNRVYAPDLQPFQHPRANLGRSDHDRDHAAAAFPVRDAYRVDDVIAFLRLQHGPVDSDYAWCGTRWPVCNMAGQQMLAFDPDGDGAYMAWGRGFAARQAIYRIHADFAFAPQLHLPALPLPPLAEALAAVENQAAGRQAKLEAVIELAEQHPGDAQCSFIAARKSFLLKQPELFADYARRAYHLNPAVPEYRLYAGLAAFHHGDFERARLLLEPLPATQFFPEQALYRLWTLETIYRDYHPELAAGVRREAQNLLDAHDAQAYFTAAVVPLLSALLPGSSSSTLSARRRTP
jgi:tetratricopeptide (TPR) repeat protein